MFSPRQVIIKGPTVVNCTLQTASFHATSRLNKSPTHYYDILGVTPKATHAQIKSAFYKLSKVYHPDRSGASAERFHELNEAFEVLGSHAKRRQYDRGLLNPTDHRSGHDASNNVEDADISTFKHRHYKRRGPIVTGRTKHYDFDEYYKQHYGDQVNQAFRKKHNKNYERLYGQGIQHEHGNADHHRNISPLMIWGIFFVMMMYICMPNFEFIRKLERSPITEHADKNPTSKHKID